MRQSETEFSFSEHQKPAGWKGKANDGSDYWQKETGYGMRCMCRHCGMQSAGYGSSTRGHSLTCSKFGEAIAKAKAESADQYRRASLLNAINATIAAMSIDDLEQLNETLKVTVKTGE